MENNWGGFVHDGEKRLSLDGKTMGSLRSSDSSAKAKSFKDATGIDACWGCSWATIGLLQGVPVK
ncbi:hypothetical protein [Prosthecobacter sp.]|uniref:hypothetical protein n=1 Tax=Prosthecobacter sp. TaxID=1965333 RepID=UPI00378370ED